MYAHLRAVAATLLTRRACPVCQTELRVEPTELRFHHAAGGSGAASFFCEEGAAGDASPGRFLDADSRSTQAGCLVREGGETEGHGQRIDEMLRLYAFAEDDPEVAEAPGTAERD